MSAFRLVTLAFCIFLSVSFVFYFNHSSNPTGLSQKTSTMPVVSVGKPNVPITLEAKASGVAEVGSPVLVSIEARPTVAAPLFTVEVRPPEGVVVQAGLLQWEGPLNKEQKKEHTVTLSLSERKRKVVTVLAGIHFNDGSRVYKAAEVVLEPTGTFKASPPGVIIDRGGARVIEHKGVER